MMAAIGRGGTDLFRRLESGCSAGRVESVIEGEGRELVQDVLL